MINFTIAIAHYDFLSASLTFCARAMFFMRS